MDYKLSRLMCNYCAQGKWEFAEQLAKFNPNPNLLKTKIHSESGSTALCIAAMAGQTNFIKNLVKVISKDDLLVQDSSNFTALHNVATTGNKEAAKILVDKNPNLTRIRNNQQETPLSAALFGHEELLRYLLTVTKDEDPSPFRGLDGATLLVTVIDANLYDVALYLVNEYEEIATTKGQGGRSAIQALATKSWPSTITQSHKRCSERPSTNSMLGTWNTLFEKASKHLATAVPSLNIKYTNKLMYGKYLELVKCILDEVERLNDAKKMLDLIGGTVLDASEHGNVDFIKSIIRIDYNRITDSNDTCLSILHNAIKHRQKEVFYYLKNLGYKDELALKKDAKSQETILHLAAKRAPTHKLEEIPGAALQVQYEIYWYKEVEKIVQPFYRDRKTKKKMSPKTLFTKEHKDLVKKGEEWMKHMASSSMLVCTLIATVAFAAAFTVPGGNSQDKGPLVGMPIFLSERAYMVFAVSNALAFFSSLTSVLIFLSILTARYAEEDFLRSLPQKLIIGLAMLFIAIATMGMAFIATYFLMLGHKRAWIAILMAVLTCVPVTLFAFLQIRLFVGMIKSTYRSTL